MCRNTRCTRSCVRTMVCELFPRLSLVLIFLFAGCDFECWHARDMVMHHKQPKHRGQALKPDAGPVAPDLAGELPPMPATLPSYMSVSRPVRAARISVDRHEALQAKVCAKVERREASNLTRVRRWELISRRGHRLDRCLQSRCYGRRVDRSCQRSWWPASRAGRSALLGRRVR